MAKAGTITEKTQLTSVINMFDEHTLRAAEIVGVSPIDVIRAERINKYAPDLAEAVWRNELSLDEAYQIAKRRFP